jgi:alpha-galactosidase
MTKVAKPSTERPYVKIAYIGGGSRYWARDLMKDLALQAPFDGEIVLYDIDFPAAQRNAEIGARIFGHADAKSQFKVSAIDNISNCLKGANFVVLSIEPGPMTCRHADLVIPEKYGIIQPVGDTTGPGGILRALRSIHLYTGFAREIMEHCPNAWVINYTNPMTLCTRALYHEAPQIKAFGCCHEVFGAQKRLLSLGMKHFPMDDVKRNEIIVDVNGVNHFTWLTDARYKGFDLLKLFKEKSADPETYFDATEKCLERIQKKEFFTGEYLVSHDLTRRFGAMAAAGNRHLVEFVPWYVVNEKNLHRWGVVCTPYQFRIDKRSGKDTELDIYSQGNLNPTGEEGVKQMAALLGFGEVRTNVNLPNRGQSPGLPLESVVETNALFSQDSVAPIVSRPLPAGAHQLVDRIVQVQELTLKAALAEDSDLAFQALLCDPLVNIDTDAARKMFSEMLDYVRPQLSPNFK